MILTEYKFLLNRVKKILFCLKWTRHIIVTINKIREKLFRKFSLRKMINKFIMIKIYN